MSFSNNPITIIFLSALRLRVVFSRKWETAIFRKGTPPKILNPIIAPDAVYVVDTRKVIRVRNKSLCYKNMRPHMHMTRLIAKIHIFIPLIVARL